ncbi:MULTISPECIES: LysR substrate-binding domain-containing protein [Pseudomonas]|uniref:LysR substrate-binding domain-containing protein n=1 Tax=Pseudomonas TaxID=286 RepID=UPI002DB94C9B|nr:LysR substrate-binding domain-containing protein [Pseudomonas asiatica]MEB6589537.1 LysR substrate-binding domain-containing protein [Pseudomonas asiatica]
MFKERLLENPQGLIRIAVPRSLYGTCHQLIPEFLECYPDVNVQLISNEGSLDFIAESIDIGIRITDAPPLGLVARRLFPVDFIACVADSYLEKHGRPAHPSALVASWAPGRRCHSSP